MRRCNRSNSGLWPSLALFASMAGIACLPLNTRAQTTNDLDRILFEPQPLDVALLLANAPPSTAIAATAIEPVLLQAAATPGLDAIQKYRDSIATEELANGPYAPALVEQLLALGEALQHQGDHAAALESFNKAEQVARISSGLYTPQQFLIVENMIASHLVRGELEQANARQQYLLFIKRQYYGADSTELVPALAALGNWNLDAFRSMLNQSNASDFPLGLNTSGGGGINMPNPKLLAFFNLYQAQGHYYQAILNMVNHQQYTDPRLLELEHNLVETVFLAANRNGIMSNPDFYLGARSTYTGTRIARNLRGYSLTFMNGRNAYERMRIYQEVTRGTEPVAVAQTIIALGDWYLLFERQSTALNFYREAQRYMKEHGVPEATIAALLTPPVPQQLPAFTPLPHSREKFGLAPDATVAYAGYVDVNVSLSRFGKVKDIEVLGQTGPLTSAMERRLRRMLHSSPFRPRFVAGEPATRDQVALRYYFAHID